MQSQFSSGKDDDAGALAPVKEEDEAWRKLAKQLMLDLGVTDY